MVAAVSMVKDEADIVGVTVAWMREQVDLVIVADNGSSDATRDILASIPDIVIVDDPEPGYYQSQKMTALAAQARRAGATWVVPFDADEIHFAVSGRRIADELAALPADILISEASLFDHVATAQDLEDQSPIIRMPWRRRAQAPLRKIACRARGDLAIHQGNHGASYQRAPVTPMVTGHLQVRHFPYRSPEQMVRKALNGRAAYAATDLPADAGKHWRDYAALVDRGGPEALHEVFRRWFWSPDPAADPELINDPSPPWT